MKHAIIYLALFLLSAVSIAQEDKKQIIAGNQAFNEGDYSGAEEAYRSAEGSESFKDIANFNLGDALYRQGKFEEAAEYFGQVAQESENSDLRSRAYHNLGNSQLSQQDFAKAMNAYKQALRLNPEDAESRYNLAYSRKMLQQQEQEQQQKQEEGEDGEEKEENEENKEKQDGDQENEGDEQDQGDDQQEGDENQEGDEDQEGDGQDEEKDDSSNDGKDGDEEQKKDGDQEKNGDGKDGDNGEEKPMPLNPDDISPEDAARILEALDKAEEDLQGKLRKNKKGKGKKIEKDW